MNWGANRSEDLPAFEAELVVTREPVVREAAETNLYGPWLMAEEFLPLLRRQMK